MASGIGLLHEKLKVLGRYRKEREKNLKKNFPGERVS
jgi:hypothetical protein